eukprot:m51a1_g11944 hypothetical protein (298) ;mRNA; r:742567-743460
MAESSPAPTPSASSPVQRVALLYYSLTGNTRHVAELLRDALAAQGFEATALDITAPDCHRDAAVAALAAADAVGVGAVTVGYREPTNVRTLLHGLPESAVAGKPAIVFGTAGDNEGKMLANIAGALTHKGAVVVGSFVAYAPGNFAPWGAKRGSTFQWGSRERSKPAEFARDVAPLLRARPPKAAKVCSSLMGYAVSWLASDSRLRNIVGRIEVDRDACVKCHLCVRQCPSGALDVEEADGVPRWSEDKCTGCCRCINYCPKNCINSSGTRSKQQYQFKPEWLAEGNFIIKTIKPSS